ncbi:MAG: hypothetical protein ACLQDM_32870 [Bradyrhizobium sp.]
MSELHDWLVSQHPGLRTYKSFHQKALELAASDADHRALYRLLANMAERYVSTFDEEPLPVDVAALAYQRFLDIVGDAEKSIGAPVSQRVQTLNRIAAAELF